MSDPNEQIAALQEAMASLEARRNVLGEAVIERALAPLREQLAALEGAGALPAQQRRQMTVLFADIPGFTAWAEALDAEEVADLRTAWPSIKKSAIGRGSLPGSITWG